MALLRFLAFSVLLATSLLAVGAERTVSLAGDTEVRVWVFTPRDAGDGPWPLAMMIPAGSGQEYAVKAQFWLGREMTKRGWVVAIPVSPEGLSFVGDSENNISQVITELQKDEAIRVGRTLLLGVSSGGSSALEIASKNPAAYHGVVAVPGRIKQSGPLPALDGLPIFLRVAEKDYFRWNKQMPDMTQRLVSAGARVDAALVPDARHVIKVDMDELDRWLLNLDR
ncbi:MAG: dienelactone hydrolase family protein [Gammaproteobacteria bacterium]|nr:dienelactone hydrolase family protein [Pseudomonadales bacterium]MCP5346721.1 dienelactone hydrolase family protein [Pseudomonadales bacterium]